MKSKTDASTFMDVLQDHMQIASSRPDLPELRIALQVTRPANVKKVKPPFKVGRPDFAKMMSGISERHGDESTLVFACGPGAMVNTVWDESNKRNTKTRRVHFHHETFEF
jgi:ferredoxin-NADP reductase